MIIHQPEILEHGEFTIAWARLELEANQEDHPRFLWYRIPSEYAGGLSLQSDAFLLPGMLAGMHFGEDIEVRGTVSPRYAYVLDEYQYLLHRRLPDSVRPVNIRYAHLKKLDGRPKAVGSTFSGGVDSLFTLWKHLPENQPLSDFRITHALFIMGFDIVRKKEAKYQSLLTRYRTALKELNIELIPVETNSVSLVVPRMSLNWHYGPILAGCAHLFAGLFMRFYIPSSRDYYILKTRESSSEPLADGMLSSDTLDLIHHGAPYRRVEKVKAISDWEFAQRNLRVCTVTDSEWNCSRCEKCIRTMIPLYALGKMDRFRTFKKPFQADRDMLWWARKFEAFGDYIPEMIPFVRQQNRRLIPWLWVGLLLGYLRAGLLRLIPAALKDWLKRFGYFVDLKEEKNAYENQQVIALLQDQDRFRKGEG
jgi:hypothetical protein